MSDGEFGFLVFLGIVIWTGLAVSIGVSLGDGIGEHKTRIEAVEGGHAHWNTAPNGSTTFEWNPKQ